MEKYRRGFCLVLAAYDDNNDRDLCNITQCNDEAITNSNIENNDYISDQYI